MAVSYESYVELWRITAWRDGCVYATESLGYRWVAGETVKANRPADTSLIYTAADDDFARHNMTIRVKR